MVVQIHSFKVSHVVFWHRYFYKVSRLEAAEARRQELKQRAEKTNTESELVWDEGKTRERKPYNVC